MAGGFPIFFQREYRLGMLTVLLLLVLAAFVLTLASAAGKTPLWPAVFVLCVVALLERLPLGR